MLIPNIHIHHNYLRQDKVKAATEVARYFSQIKNPYTKNGKLVITGSMNSQKYSTLGSKLRFDKFETLSCVQHSRKKPTHF